MSFLRAGSSFASNVARSSACSLGSTSSFSFAGFHTSASRLAESQKQRTARLVRKTNIERRAERARLAADNRPHVVLGTRPGEDGETKWRNCDLAKTIVTEEELASLPLPVSPASDSKKAGADSSAANTGVHVEPPKHLNYGIDNLPNGEGREMFFHELPQTSFVSGVEASTGDFINPSEVMEVMNEDGDTHIQNTYNTTLKSEAKKVRQFAQLVDLRNANAKGIAFENRRRIVEAFAPKGSSGDTGYPEVQVALLTLKIRNIWSHLMQRKKDVHGRRAIRLLIHQRAKMLKYIKRLDRDRYDRILERVALEPEAVEGELVV